MYLAYGLEINETTELESKPGGEALSVAECTFHSTAAPISPDYNAY